MRERIKIFLRKIFSFFPLKKKREKFIPRYEVGDVVYAFMPVKKEELVNIPSGHERRPYLIVDIDYENGFYKSFLFTSDIKKRKGSSALIYYNNDSDERISCVVTQGLWHLSDNNIINFDYKIDDKNALDIAKKMLTSDKEEILNAEFLEKYKDKIVLERGDIIKINDFDYYVYAKDADYKYFMLEVYEPSVYIPKEILKKCIFVRGKYINFSNLELIDLKDIDYTFEKVLFNTDSLLIEDERKRYKTLEKSRKRAGAQRAKKKSLKNEKAKQTNKSDFNKKEKYVNNSLYNSKFSPGTVVEINDTKYIFLYTDFVVGINYFVDVNAIENGFNFIVSFSVSEKVKFVDKLSKEEFLRVLRRIKSYLRYVDDERVAGRLRKLCNKR